jgi:hypothetical protein
MEHHGLLLVEGLRPKHPPIAEEGGGSGAHIAPSPPSRCSSFMQPEIFRQTMDGLEAKATSQRQPKGGGPCHHFGKTLGKLCQQAQLKRNATGDTRSPRMAKRIHRTPYIFGTWKTAFDKRGRAVLCEEPMVVLAITRCGETLGLSDMKRSEPLCLCSACGQVGTSFGAASRDLTSFLPVPTVRDEVAIRREHGVWCDTDRKVQCLKR